MANIASNEYLFYGDRTELVKCYEELSKLYENVGHEHCCVDMTAENTVVNCEWIECIEELSDDADSFWMDTSSKWYGNPLYWNDWVKTNFPKLSVAFKCEEFGCDIFEKVDPDNKFDDYIYIHGYCISEEDMEKLPTSLKGAVFGGSLFGTFLRDGIFNSEFQPSDLPDSITYEEYNNITYDAIRDSDVTYLSMLSNTKEVLQQYLPENMLPKTYISDAHDSIQTTVHEYIDKWKNNNKI